MGNNIDENVVFQPTVLDNEVLNPVLLGAGQNVTNSVEVPEENPDI